MEPLLYVLLLIAVVVVVARIVARLPDRHGLVACPDCKSRLRPKNLARHRARVHAAGSSVPAKKNPATKNAAKPVAPGKANPKPKQTGNKAKSAAKPKGGPKAAPQPATPRAGTAKQPKPAKPAKKQKRAAEERASAPATSRARGAPAVKARPLVVIDGLNVIRQCGKDTPRLELLLAVAIHSVRRGFDVLCISDANTRHELGSKQGAQHRALYEELLDRHPRNFVECAAASQADPLILAEASHNTALVISNDRFEPYRAQHPWIDDRARFLRAKVIRDRLYLGDQIIEEVSQPPATLARELRKLL